MTTHSKSRLLRAAALVWLNRALLRTRLRRAKDGWRRGASLCLTQETSRFVLSAFNLDALSDAPPNADPAIHIASRLNVFLQTEPDSHHHIEPTDTAHIVRPHDGPGYSLRFEPRPAGAPRFIRPDTWTATSDDTTPRNPLPVFEFVCRTDDHPGVDLWLRINHTAADGVPVQEMLTRLERAWGTTGPVTFPTPEEFSPHSHPRPTPGRPDAVELQTFIDFSPLLAWRKKQNQVLPEPITVSAALQWWLAKHRAFPHFHFGSTVDVPPVNGLNRGVGVVVVKPADYFDKPNGLARYVKHFNRQVALTRRRATASHKTLDAAAHLPPDLAKAALIFGLHQGKHAFGRIGLSIIKDAKVFVAPLGDAGHGDGFIAIGNTSLPTSSGPPVACVTIKGLSPRIATHAQILREVIHLVAESQ